MAVYQDITYLQSLLDKYQVQADINDLLERWQEPHRFYHNISHLDDLLQQITTNFAECIINERQKEELMLTALFHDIIYDPTCQDNEEQSAQFFLDMCTDTNSQSIKDIHAAILDTKKHSDSTPLATIFNKYDMSIVEQDFPQLLIWEHGIYNEYKMFGNIIYKTGRLKFLEAAVKKYPHNRKNLEGLIAWVLMNY